MLDLLPFLAIYNVTSIGDGVLQRGVTMAKKRGAAKRKPTRASASALPARFTGAVPGTITRDEIYHRLEWFFDASHNPRGPHRINPNTPIGRFFSGADPSTGRQILWNSLNQASQQFFPAWNSRLFHGVLVPWASQLPAAIGIRDVQEFGGLINAFVLAYTHAGVIVR